MSFLFRRNIVIKTGAWDVGIKRNQEVDFQLRAVLAGGNFDYQALTCGLWRTHEQGSITNTSDLQGAIHFFDKWEKILIEKKMFSKKIQEGFVSNFFWFLGTHKAVPVAQQLTIYKKIYSLQPGSAVFHSFKFRLLQKIIGFDNTLKLFVRLKK